MNDEPVICFCGRTDYDLPLPYHPPEAYPELALPADAVEPGNRIYAGVRDMLRALGYDAERYGSADWSPLSALVAPGGTVVVKPNFVRHYNETTGQSVETVITHLSVMRPLVDYALKAVGPEGRVVIADAPQYDCDVDALLETIGMPRFLDWYRERGTPVEWRDLRVQFGRHDNGVVLERRVLPGDPEGYEAVDLAEASEFGGLEDQRMELLRGADYDEEVTLAHHRAGRNEYLVAKTVLNADLLINCPKIKTHKKAGVTLSMKNLIGINGDKNWLPHYRSGFVSGGGDEFPSANVWSRMRRAGADFARGLLKRGIGGAVFRRMRRVENAVGLGDRARNGNWWGNDTIWRTAIDLGKVVTFGDRQGRLAGPADSSRPPTPVRRVLHVYDGVVAGEGQGPMGPTARPLGLLAAAEDPVAADCALAWVMGFDWRRIPVLARALGVLRGDVRLSAFTGDPDTLSVRWLDPDGERTLRLSEIELDLGFRAHPGWAGRIERRSLDEAACAS